MLEYPLIYAAATWSRTHGTTCKSNLLKDLFVLFVSSRNLSAYKQTPVVVSQRVDTLPIVFSLQTVLRTYLYKKS